jgi:hypothetical protein
MKTNSLFAALFLSVLFFLDILKPFAYYLHAEFFLLGVIAAAFMFPFTVALLGSIFGGVVFDCISSAPSMRSVEFPLYVLGIRYVLVNFESILARRAAGLLCILAHITFVSLFLQSVLLLSLLYCMIKQWTTRLSVDSI